MAGEGDCASEVDNFIRYINLLTYLLTYCCGDGPTCTELKAAGETTQNVSGTTNRVDGERVGGHGDKQADYRHRGDRSSVN